MATSGTYTFDLDLADVLEEAFERCGSELRSGYDYRTGRRSLNLLLLEWQNKGLNLWTIDSASQALTAGTASFALTGEKLDIIEAMLRTGSGTSQSDLSMRRVSISTFAQQTNKNSTGRPIQYWLSRTSSGITVNLWPVPDASQSYTFVYYYMKQIEDAGASGAATLDVPTRHLPALTAGLAYYLSLKLPEASARSEGLKAVYDEQWNLAADSVREKASWYLRPGGGY